MTRSGEVLEEVQFWPQCPQSWDVQDKRGVNYRYCARRKDSPADPRRPVARPSSSRAFARSGVSFRERLVSPVKRRSGAPKHSANSAHSFASNSASFGLRSVCRSKNLNRLARMLASRDTRSRYARSPTRACGRQDETMSPEVNVRASRCGAFTGKWSGGSESRLFEARAVPAELRREHNAPSDIFPARREFTKGDIVSAQGRGGCLAQRAKSLRNIVRARCGQQLAVRQDIHAVIALGIDGAEHACRSCDRL